MKNTIILVLSLLCFLQVAEAQTKVGTTAANFLTIPVGPKATGMGGAYAGLANDATAIFWNPGAMSRLKQSEFTVAYSEWLVKTNYNWFGLVYKMSEEDAVGLSINQLNYGEEEITDELNPNGTGRKWNAQDIAFSLSYSRSLTDRFSIGGSLKYIRQQIYRESASAYAMDIGILFMTQIKGLNLAMNISNFGTDMKLDGEDLFKRIDIDYTSLSGNNENIAGSMNTDVWSLPLTFTVGLGYSSEIMQDWVLRAATDAVYPNNQTAYLNAGGEVIYSDMFALRFGWNSLFKKAAEEGLCAGIGIKYDFGGFYTRVDYSYNDFGIFNQISKIGVTIGF